MIHDMVGAEALHPGTRLVSRCRRNHDKVGELPGKLDGHGTDPAGATYDKDGVARAWYRPADIKAIKERLPGGNRRKRDSGRLRVRQRARLGAGEPFVNQVKFGVGALTIDGAGVEDGVAAVEQGRLRPDVLDDPRGIPTENTVQPVLRRGAQPHLGIYRIDRNRQHANQQIAAAGQRTRHLDIHEGRRILNG